MWRRLLRLDRRIIFVLIFLATALKIILGIDRSYLGRS